MRYRVLYALCAGLTLLATGCDQLAREIVAPRQTPAVPADQSMRWPSLPVTYCLDLREDGYAAAAAFTRLVDQAFSAWGVPASSGGRCDGAMREDDARNQIGWGAPPAPSDAGRGAYEAGFTRIRYKACDGHCTADSVAELVEADIIIDEGPPRAYRNQRCLYSIILHEVGHFLGLPHLPAPAVMSAVSTSCRQAPTEVDLRALAQHYGDDLARR